jgi:O-methyltransferase
LGPTTKRKKQAASDNFFIIRYFDWAPLKPSARVERLNRWLKKLGRYSTLQPPRYSGEMTNVEQRINLYHLVSQVLAYEVPGELVELGCNQGHSSVLIQKVIQEFDPSRKFHVYDSFEGLPSLAAEDKDTPYTEGLLKTSRDALIQNFEMHKLPLPEIHQGWFQDTLPTGLPDRISFAYLDGDLYESIKISLEYVYPRLSKGAICVIDDYADPSIYPEAWNQLPGVKAACDEYLADKPESMCFLYSAEMSHGFFRKL